ncbi:GGDEF domain-containing protein [Faecalispora anaeroviscerum]|uniref:GGDEF domain-containing protein n=1 Tax=Faecalispora anaeroviscerum TaxID=2991836 RepID=UPI0024B97833|nr:GGDEF domain-containing protein [Faecalispora anaeroviscerum]
MRSDNSLIEILRGGYIKPVYQPIASLRDGSILGYEALSRISLPGCEIKIEELFDLATSTQRLWELERLCRTQALKNAVTKPVGARLFLNVDPNIIYDPEFISGFTSQMLREFGMNPDEVIFEITEKSSVSVVPVFISTLAHYQKQNFQIAIDDFGSGYSGLVRVCALSPNFLKIDMGIVRDIDRDSRKKSVMTGIVKFCKEAGIQVIAEGIETKEELATLIQVGVDYGQGFFLARPNEKFQRLPGEIKLLMKEARDNSLNLGCSGPAFCHVGAICSKKEALSEDAPALSVYQAMCGDPSMTEVCIINHDGTVCGLLTRQYLLGRFSGQFGYSLYSRRTVKDLVQDDFLSVDSGKAINDVAAQAMEREPKSMYDAVVITEGKRYLGIVTVRDLLNAAINIRVRNAADANPLTGLPGNNAIQRAIEEAMLGDDRACAIIYLDLDHFKAYNDAYGFSCGDNMLRLVAHTMNLCCSAADFKGHIGGDDFIILTRDTECLPELCDNLIATFSRQVRPLYSKEDWERGYIISKNRNGFAEDFPVATLSIAAVTNRTVDFSQTELLSKTVAAAKKQSKQKQGHSVVIV